MAGGTPRPNAFAVLKSNYVQNVVHISDNGWFQPENTSLVQLYEHESCNIGDYYFPAGSPPTGRFQYVVVADEADFEGTLKKPVSRMQSGGSDSGTLYVPGSVYLGTDDSIYGAVYYLKFQDGTTMGTAPVASVNGSTGAVGISAGSGISITQNGNTYTVSFSNDILLDGGLF